MLTLHAPQLPLSLLPLSNPVKKLHIIGEGFDDLLHRPRLAIVGSRRFSPYGKGVTEMLASQLAEKGVVIISGLALGTDSIAHQACLSAGGQTIAVLPCGAHRVYPASHTHLAHSIVNQGGVLVTEYDGDHLPREYNFLERNRIIAALSEGVIVTEAAIRSGSLNTANHALQLGKPVFAVPGNITSPLSAGCNALIKAGAIPVTCVEDILHALEWVDVASAQKKVEGATEEERTILSLIHNGVGDGHELLIRSELEVSSFNQALTMLEITGKIRPLGANQWSL